MVVYDIFGCAPGKDPRLVCHVDLEPGEAISINRSDVPPPSLRASELLHRVGQAPKLGEMQYLRRKWESRNLLRYRWQKRRRKAEKNKEVT